MLLSISEIIETSWRAYVKNWRVLVPYMVLLFLPSLVILVLGFMGVYLDELLPSSAIISDVIIIIVKLASLLFVLWVTVALTQAADILTRGQVPGLWKAVLTGATPLLWPFVFTSIIVSLVVIGGTLLLIIPGIIFSIWYAFAAYAAILDNQTGLVALKFSKNLVLGRWWTMLACLLVPGILFGLLPAIIHGIIMQIISFVVTSPAIFDIIKTGMAGVINAIFLPLSVLAVVVLYQSAKQNPATPTPSPPLAK